MLLEIITDDKLDIESRSITKSFISSVGRGQIKVSRLYLIESQNDISYFEKIAREILSDPVVEKYDIHFDLKEFFKGLDYSFFIDVWLKKSVTDVVAKSVSQAIADFGLSKPLNVRTGKRFYFRNCELSKAKKFVLEEFANEIINTLEVINGENVKR